MQQRMKIVQVFWAVEQSNKKNANSQADEFHAGLTEWGLILPSDFSCDAGAHHGLSSD